MTAVSANDAARPPMSPEAQQLAEVLRSELSGPPPAGSRTLEVAALQESSLEALAKRLLAMDPPEVEAAIAQLIDSEEDGWTYLKLVALCRLLSLDAAAPSLLRRMLDPPADVEARRLFLSGLTAEALLGLSLDPETRARVQERSGPWLSHLARVRERANGRIADHEPKASEVGILWGAMALAIAGLAAVFLWP